MKKPILLIGLILLLPFICYSQTTLTFAWDYNAEEISHVQEWKLYQSQVSGGPYALVPVSIMKIEDKITYEEVIPTDDMVSGVVYFVVTAYGDDTFPIDKRESDYSNEVSHIFKVGEIMNLRITNEG